MDEVIKSEFIYQNHTDVLTHKTTQPTENIILERNNELRKNKGAIHDLGDQISGEKWGRKLADIPFIVYYKAIKDGYELNAHDKIHRQKELYRFLQTEEGKKCLVTEDLIVSNRRTK